MAAPTHYSTSPAPPYFWICIQPVACFLFFFFPPLLSSPGMNGTGRDAMKLHPTPFQRLFVDCSSLGTAHLAVPGIEVAGTLCNGTEDILLAETLTLC